MNPKFFGLLTATLLALPVRAEAQQPRRVATIGILELASVSGAGDGHKAFQQRLRDLGYVEGKTVFFEYRYADGKTERLPELAADLVHSHVDIIATRSTAAIRAAKNATKTIPIVFAAVGAPVEDGLVASLAKPGGNVTGVALLSADLDGKKLELLREVFPKVVRVGFLWTTGNARADARVEEVQTAARALGLRVEPLRVSAAADFDAAFESAKKTGV